jgi:hypothetical protein
MKVFAEMIYEDRVLIVEEIISNKTKELFDKMKINQEFYIPEREEWKLRIQKKYKKEDQNGNMALYIRMRILWNDLRSMDDLIKELCG